jgi:hypothetical protein
VNENMLDAHGCQPNCSRPSVMFWLPPTDTVTTTSITIILLRLVVLVVLLLV